MPQVGFRLAQDEYDKLVDAAASGGQTLSACVRSIVIEHLGGAPDSRRVDEILALVIQVGSILAVSVGSRSPALLEQGIREARQIQATHGLIAEIEDAGPTSAAPKTAPETSSPGGAHRQ